MKILFLFTGGTIGSTASGDTITTDSKKPYLLLETYKAAYGISFEYDTKEPYTALSENNTGKTLRHLCESVKSHLDGGYDGIVITHGTDTLQYSAAALSYAFADIKIPVCLVSSNLPIEKKGANGIPNLRAAIRFGADAVYLAGKQFGMRSAADNFTNEELDAAIDFVHANGKKLYLTVNTNKLGYITK